MTSTRSTGWGNYGVSCLRGLLHHTTYDKMSGEFFHEKVHNHHWLSSAMPVLAMKMHNSKWPFKGGLISRPRRYLTSRYDGVIRTYAQANGREHAISPIEWDLLRLLCAALRCALPLNERDSRSLLASDFPSICVLSDESLSGSSTLGTTNQK
jgi:hypothetical protein